MSKADFHVKFYHLAQPGVRAYLTRKLNYTPEPIPETDGPVLVMANHATDYDPFLIVCASRKHMYFLASEHVYRMGFVSSLIRFFLAPISRVKGASDLSAVKAMLGTIRSGHSVAFFPEGSRTFNGESVPVTPAAAKLAIKAGVPLVTYRLRGGYLTTPRWAKTARLGKMTGEYVRTYQPEEMKELGVEALTEAINRDIYVNAYEDQKTVPVAYEGNVLAEGLEETCYICPKCGRIGTICGNGDFFRCDCGFSVRLDPEGFFRSPNGSADAPPFPDVLAWDRWQLSELERRIGSDPAFALSDPGFTLSVLNDDEETAVGTGTLTMTREALTFVPDGKEPLVFPLSGLAGFAIIHRKGTESLVFTSERTHYQLSADTAVSRYKYYSLWTILQKI